MRSPDEEKQSRHWLARKRYRAPALAIFALLAAGAHLYAYFRWDLRAARGAQMWVLPKAELWMQIISLPGNGLTPYFLTALTTLWLLWRRWPAAAGALLLSVGGSAALNSLLKWCIGRPRPTAQNVAVLDNFGFLSFPSGHVTFYVCYFGFLLLLAREYLPPRAWRWAVLFLLAVPIALVGLSRIALGAHWPSDTLGAYLWSSVWLGFAWEMYWRWQPAENRS